MTEKEHLAQGLTDAGCNEEAVDGICALYQAGNYPEMLRQMKKQREEQQRKLRR